MSQAGVQIQAFIEASSTASTGPTPIAVVSARKGCRTAGMRPRTAALTGFPGAGQFALRADRAGRHFPDAAAAAIERACERRGQRGLPRHGAAPGVRAGPSPPGTGFASFAAESAANEGSPARAGLSAGALIAATLSAAAAAMVRRHPAEDAVPAYLIVNITVLVARLSKRIANARRR